MDDKVKSIYGALGAMSEMCGIFYKSLLKQGFSQQESLELTKVFLAAQIANIVKPKNPSQDGGA